MINDTYIIADVNLDQKAFQQFSSYHHKHQPPLLSYLQVATRIDCGIQVRVRSLFLSATR